MQATIVNGAPMLIPRGTQDLSTRPLPRTPEQIPQHLPKFFLYAKKGPTTPQLVVGDALVKMFGGDTFDPRKPWYNHSTVFATGVNAKGNAIMVERLEPTDAGPKSNMLLSLDVLPMPIPLYQRGTDGTFLLDGSSNKIPEVGAPVVPGYKVRWVLTTIATKAGLQTDFGLAVSGPGAMTHNVTQSTMYPIMQLRASDFGEDGNNLGVRIWSPTVKTSGGVKQAVISNQLAYPFRAQVIRRENAQASPYIVPTEFSEQTVDFTFKPGVTDPLTEKALYLGKNFIQSYQNIDDPRYVPVIGDFGGLAIYDANIATLANLFTVAEKANPYTENDFTGAVDEQYKFNFVGGVSSSGTPYNTFMIETTGVNTVRLTEFSNLFAKSGSDGTMTHAAHAALVTTRMAAYLNADDPVQDMALNVESHFYDTGFPLATKYALINAIAVRKDTVVALTTHDAGGPELTASEEHSLGTALRTRLQLFPESDYYGTPVMRGLVVGHSSTLRDSLYDKKVPALYEVAVKSADYMGSSDGKWKSGKSPEGFPGSILEYVYGMNVKFTTATARNKDWDIGLNYPQAYDRRSDYFPALKTVYSDDTSVLNSWLTVCAIAWMNKVTGQVHREFTGRSDLTDAQLIERVNQSFTNRINAAFDNRFVVIPEAYISDSDAVRGYSWTLPVKIYANNMKTVMTTSFQSYRMSDLTA